MVTSGRRPRAGAWRFFSASPRITFSARRFSLARIWLEREHTEEESRTRSRRLLLIPTALLGAAVGSTGGGVAATLGAETCRRRAALVRVRPLGVPA